VKAAFEVDTAEEDIAVEVVALVVAFVVAFVVAVAAVEGILVEVVALAVAFVAEDLSAEEDIQVVALVDIQLVEAFVDLVEYLYLVLEAFVEVDNHDLALEESYLFQIQVAFQGLELLLGLALEVLPL